MKLKFKGFIFRVLGSSFLLILVLLIAAGSVYYLESSGYFQIESFEISVYQPERQEVYMASFLEVLKSELQKKVGQSLLQTNLKDLVRDLKKTIWVKEVNVRRVWPHQVHVQVYVKSIELLFRNSKSEVQTILEDGTFLQGPSKEFPQVPFLLGKHVQSQLELRKKALEFINSIPKEGRFQEHEIQEIQFSEKEGFLVVLKNSELKVKFGTQDIETKSHRVSQVLDYLEVHKIQAESLDLNVEKKAFVKIKNNTEIIK